tara:strand:- start:210 stop:434 length:225 start_codon:yes stop_codon:yes gene_type:complete
MIWVYLFLGYLSVALIVTITLERRSFADVVLLEIPLAVICAIAWLINFIFPSSEKRGYNDRGWWYDDYDGYWDE